MGKKKKSHLLRTLTLERVNVQAMYVTGYYTMVAMVIIHEDRLPALLPFFSVSRKHCIPLASSI